LCTISGCERTRNSKACDVAVETLDQAQIHSVDYCALVFRANSGDDGAIQELLRISCIVDAAGAIGHGVVLVDILVSTGDEKFSAILGAQTPDVTGATFRAVEAGFAYSRRADLPKPSAFPLTLSRLRRSGD
jgi:hypothetical protein